MKEIFSVFSATLSPMLVLFICMVIGFILNKKELIPRDTAQVLSKLENYILVPSLIINTFSKYCTPESVSENYKYILYSLIALFMAIVIAVPLSKLFAKKPYDRNIYIYALAFGNFSFMGNAIVPAIMGEEYLYNYMLFTLSLNVAVYTWGVLMLIPKSKSKKSPLKALLNPIFISIIIGATLGLSGASNYMPKFIGSTVSGFAACMGPLAMVLTGFVVADFDVAKLLKKRRVYTATALRLIVFPAIFVSVLYFLGADIVTLSLAFFAFGTPLGLNTVVFPAAYGGDTSIGASMAMISHTLCIITIPLLYSLLTIIV
ncbi:MAG: hypothetical protein E7396_02770 [Ruminococcaceae bacterium]|nr:hypothetical protein [Oscillospiraceae bacterium]